MTLVGHRILVPLCFKNYYMAIQFILLGFLRIDVINMSQAWDKEKIWVSDRK